MPIVAWGKNSWGLFNVWGQMLCARSFWEWQEPRGARRLWMAGGGVDKPSRRMEAHPPPSRAPCASSFWPSKFLSTGWGLSASAHVHYADMVPVPGLVEVRSLTPKHLRIIFLDIWANTKSSSAMGKLQPMRHQDICEPSPWAWANSGCSSQTLTSAMASPLHCSTTRTSSQCGATRCCLCGKAQTEELVPALSLTCCVILTKSLGLSRAWCPLL